MSEEDTDTVFLSSPKWVMQAAYEIFDGVAIDRTIGSSAGIALVIHEHSWPVRQMNDELAGLVRELIDQLADQYDGAPDSPVRWHGYYIERITKLLDRLEAK